MHVLISVYLLHLIPSNACRGWGGGSGGGQPVWNNTTLPLIQFYIVKKVSILREINLITVNVLTLKKYIIYNRFLYLF